MEGDLIKTNQWLAPLSWLYGMGVSLRNWMFDIGMLRETHFDIPTISVGNITVGGCGKTPHVEYLVRLLKDHYRVAVLSRGYKRKSRGFVLAEDDTPMPRIGDEPFQMKRKFPDIYVAVDKKRRNGIRRLKKDKRTRDVEVVLLDDAYQHRYVKPGLNILLVDYHRIITSDCILPAGRLREPVGAKERADVVIITKVPGSLRPIDYRVLQKTLDLRPYQHLYFTSIKYKSLISFLDGSTISIGDATKDTNMLLFTGIASPRQILTDTEQSFKSIDMMTFADHHQFSKSDMEKVSRRFAELPQPSIIVTTEKDAARLSHINDLPDNIREHLYILPIEIEFMLDKQEDFGTVVLEYIKSKKYHPGGDTDKR